MTKPKLVLILQAGLDGRLRGFSRRVGRVSDPPCWPALARFVPADSTRGAIPCFVRDVNSADEWFDVVNERDEVVRCATRREVHANGWWHRAVHVLVFDPSGRVFLQRRSMQKDLSPGKWDSSCSGHLDAGEDYDAAAIRELREEIGVRINTAPERWFRIEACEPTTWEFVWVYRLRHDGPLTLDPAEIQYGEWVSPEEVSRRVATRADDFCPSFQLLWLMAAARLQRH